jgi:hypothetical protein
VLGAASVVLAPLLLAEVYYQFFAVNLPGRRDHMSSYMHKALVAHVQRRIEDAWRTEPGKKKGLFEPPFVVFLNQGQDDEARMSQIAAASRYPRGHWLVPNCFRSPAEAESSSFRLTINSLGFRGPERPVSKPQGTFRIFLLGAYTAFGHGVNDEDTYAQRLEALLNANPPFRARFEVWNGGRQGATAIMGLARLEREISRYKPDLLIWDYGWVELYTQTETRRLKNSPVPSLRPPFYCRFARPGGAGQGWLAKSQVVSRARVWVDRFCHPQEIEGWRETTKRMVRFAEANHLPVLMLHHPGVALPISEYLPFVNLEKNIFFLNTRVGLTQILPTEAEKEAFWSAPNWLGEIHVTRDMVGSDPQIYAFVDALQYSAYAHRVYATSIDQKLRAEVFPALNRQVDSRKDRASSAERKEEPQGHEQDPKRQ